MQRLFGFLLILIIAGIILFMIFGMGQENCNPVEAQHLVC